MRTLILCVCILTYLFFGAAENLMTELRKNLRPEDKEACIVELGITNRTTDIFNDIDITNGVHLQPEMQEKKRKSAYYMKCCLKKMDMMDESGIKEQKLRSDIIKSMDGDSMEAKVHKIVHDCVEQANDVTQHCEKAFKLMECIITSPYSS